MRFNFVEPLRGGRNACQGHTFTPYLDLMRYWWANQKKNYDTEVPGGYLWCQKRRADGTRNSFYDAVRLTRPGDAIFAYADAHIKAIGLVMSPAREAVPPQPVTVPTEKTGRVRRRSAEATVGWLIDVAWLELKRPLHPASHMEILAALLPSSYAPLTPQGRGIQGGRLLELSDVFARALLQLAGGTEPEKLFNPDWRPRQLRFAFDQHLVPDPAAEPTNPQKSESL